MRKKSYVDPLKELGGKLLTVEKPARYVGGEIGRLAKKEKDFQTLIAFPDLYEIGMGNQALRILYNRLNEMPDISCDRAFAPAPDFEKLLRENNIPLYGLDTGISLESVDLLMFTLGYELGLNGILTMLYAAAIPLRCEDRDYNHPIIIAGGPAVSNPMPYSPFIDAFWIGEAEAGFFELAKELSELKKGQCAGNEALGVCRSALMEKISSHPNVWVRGKKKARRAIALNFFGSSADVYPVPSMKIVQNHGTVEIMRGCPNGCRFCHAGFWYRPVRQKSPQLIESQVNEMIKLGGWQEISLSSLSSGDYSYLGDLIEKLNQQFRDSHISFQLPSLKVSSFSLSILEKISVTRKSGLTFAVETPLNIWQMAVNKEVTREAVVSILEEAKKLGWKGAKFYFMIGLPVNKQLSMNNEKSVIEEEEIVSFIADVGRRSRMHFNINIGIFIPKPHTPYQWASQIDSETAERKLAFIRSRLKPLGHKVSISDSLISRIEGLLSRGDERSGLICEEAWRSGSRLDPWNEFIDRDSWLEILEKNLSYVESVFSGINKSLPWDNIDSCVKYEYLCRELELSEKYKRTSPCSLGEESELKKCIKCGICDNLNETEAIDYAKNKKGFKSSNFLVNQYNNTVNEKPQKKTDPSLYRILFSFSKEGPAVFHGHLSLIEIFSMSFRRAGIPVMYSQGFNPIAKMEFASSLSIGIYADNEIAIVNFHDRIPEEMFFCELNNNLPLGINIKKVKSFFIKSGMKKHSLSSLLWGFAYKDNETTSYVNARDEKVYRKSRLENNCETAFELKRTCVLAKNITNNKNNEWISYFDAYNFLYN